jgi:hypothetical protein
LIGSDVLIHIHLIVDSQPHHGQVHVHWHVSRHHSFYRSVSHGDLPHLHHLIELQWTEAAEHLQVQHLAGVQQSLQVHVVGLTSVHAHGGWLGIVAPDVLHVEAEIRGSFGLNAWGLVQRVAFCLFDLFLYFRSSFRSVLSHITISGKV